MRQMERSSHILAEGRLLPVAKNPGKYYRKMAFLYDDA